LERGRWYACVRVEHTCVAVVGSGKVWAQACVDKVGGKVVVFKLVATGQ
jgi:hypothetical protein